MLDPVFLSRLQFFWVVSWHILLPAFTVGLAVYIAVLETLWFRGRDEVESSLLAHGYRVLDVREAPDRPGREFVFITERTT